MFLLCVFNAKPALDERVFCALWEQVLELCIVSYALG